METNLRQKIESQEEEMNELSRKLRIMQKRKESSLKLTKVQSASTIVGQNSLLSKSLNFSKNRNIGYNMPSLVLEIDEQDDTKGVSSRRVKELSRHEETKELMNSITEEEGEKVDEIKAMVDQIWKTYDADNSGLLDKEETRKFVTTVLGNLGSGEMTD